LLSAHGLALAGEDTRCRDLLRVLGTSATYKLPLFKGKPIRKDAQIDVELSSSGTVAVSMVDLAIFLGASLKTVEETRLSALPTLRPRELDDGGIAFRAEVPTLIPPGGTRHVIVEKEALPLDRDVSTVTARLIGCRTLRQVGEATVSMPKVDQDPSVRLIVIIAGGLAIAIVAMILIRVWR
jgi:hypothetical protein